MSGLSETIQHLQIAASKCEQMATALLNGNNMLGEIQASMVAGLDGTPHLAEATQYQQAVEGRVTGAVQATQQLKAYVEGLVARFQGAG